jgi:hypothetical protein
VTRLPKKAFNLDVLWDKLKWTDRMQVCSSSRRWAVPHQADPGSTACRLSRGDDSCPLTLRSGTADGPTRYTSYTTYMYLPRPYLTPKTTYGA